MASPSPLLMIVSQGSTKPQPGSSNQDYSSPKSDHPKLPRGRKPTKSNKSPMKKKHSQRGMGVEKLERLRLQEKWGGGGSSLPEAAAALPAHLHQFQPPPHPLIPVAAPSPAAQFGPQLNMADPKVRILGGGSCGSLMARGWVGGLLETSRKELSSISKLTPYHHHQCGACCSKNKCHHALTGLHSNHGHNVGLEMKDFNGMTMRQIYHHVNKQEAEMMGVTRLASGLKEYEFFPSEKGLKEFEFFPAGICTSDSHTDSFTRSFEQQSHHASTEPASYYSIPSHQCTSTAASNAIDLSLKLSL